MSKISPLYDVKIWIGDSDSMRVAAMSMIDYGQFGGKSYFKGCTSIYIYSTRDKFDVRADHSETKDYFNNHPAKEIVIVPLL